MTPAQAREFYKGEMMKRIADTRGADAEAVLSGMRQEERSSARRVREGLKLAGLITMGGGGGLFVFLQAIEPRVPVRPVGLVPLLVGGAMLAYAFAFAPNE